MSNAYTPLVNLKMAYARQVFAAIENNAQGLVERQHRAALMDSCCMQLAGAYRTFMRELASHYRVAQADITRDAQQLHRALQAMSVMAPEVNEWLLLEAPESSEASWLEQMLSSAANASDPLLQGAEKSQSSASTDMIAVVDVTRSSQPVLTVDLLQEWISGLDAIISRQREAIQEF